MESRFPNTVTPAVELADGQLLLVVPIVAWNWMVWCPVAATPPRTQSAWPCASTQLLQHAELRIFALNLSMTHHHRQQIQ